MITEKVDELLDKLIYCDLRTDVGTDKAKKAIRLALKEQDRDTRHEAARRVNEIALDHDTIMKAHSVIMNSKAL